MNPVNRAESSPSPFCEIRLRLSLCSPGREWCKHHSPEWRPLAMEFTFFILGLPAPKHRKLNPRPFSNGSTLASTSNTG